MNQGSKPRTRRPTLTPLRDDEDAALDGLERLLAVERFAAGLDHVHWFANVGRPLEATDIRAAENYLTAMGAVDVTIGLVPDWEAAAEAGESPGFNTPWWEAEEMLRAGLTAHALEIVDESEFNLALTRLTERASKSATMAAEEAIALSGVSDPELIRAAAGGAVQACHLRALVDLATESVGDEEIREEDLDAENDFGVEDEAGEGSNHAFVHKFALFEAGRWPISVMGGTFHLF
ncbi:MAG: hypothetical protein HOB82_02680 [Alphaproteobacteria bacterium]|jgi:hypothetical protein|nr:hypothetical protein [Alphaproteobacteria bacterium]MBT5859748.1 hypothetical protein [Alphaproteobacteria bacterium]